MKKPIIFSTFTIILFSILGLRLLQLQVIEHRKYSELAKNNSTRVLVTRAPRGVIYDRNGNILATNKQSLSVIVYPSMLRETKKKRQVAVSLSKILDKPSNELMDIFMKMQPSIPLPLTIDNDIKVEQAIRIFENYQKLPGIAVERQAIRFYPYGNIGSHFLGYVGQVGPNELKKRRDINLSLGDIVGKEGLERVFDDQFRGVNGEERVPVDRYGRTLVSSHIPSKTFRKAVRGHDLNLTIDIELQKIAEKAMGKMPGAVVVANPQNGEILALVSNPGFDPNIFTKPISSNVYRELTASKAFLNRALSSYTPGSIFKPITALTALEHGVAARDEVLKVSGNISIGGFNFGDWTGEVAQMNLPTALSWSRNTYFYQIGRRLKPEWLSEVAEKFGIGSPTGVELLGESDGILPSPEWKQKRLKEKWYPGNTLHFSIGQSFLMVTPLQALRMISTIAMNGVMPQLHLVQDKKKEKPERTIKISDKSLNVVKEGLELCIDRGTGQASKLKDIILAGKTGSAEVHGYKRSTHGWFVAYGPVYKDLKINGKAANFDEDEDRIKPMPEIAVAVFGEGAGHGGSVCAPVARKIFEKYFENKIVKL